MLHKLRPLHHRPSRRFRLAGLALLLVATAAAGQDTEPQPVFNAQFSFSNPGARSLGFGGAFVALADDATAAFANPAGLTQLIAPEVSVEGRSWSYSTPYTARGRVGGTASGLGLDTVGGLVSERSEDDVLGVSFLSFVYPRKKWSFALFRHVLASFESTSETQGLFFGSPCCPRRFLDQRSTADLEILSYGLAAAYEVSEKLSLGLSLVSFDSSLVLDSATYRLDDDASLAGFFGPTSFLPGRMVFRSTLRIDDRDVGLSGGFLWRPSRRWRLGGVFRQGPELRIESRSAYGPGNFLGRPPGVIPCDDCRGEASFPDVYGLGAAWRSDGGRFTFAGEWDRVLYSTPIDSLELDDQTVDDGDELRLGGEVAFLGRGRVLVALRLGAWLDPDHQSRALEDLEPSDQNRFTQAILQPGGDELHVAAGVGVKLERVQIDLAVDLSDLVDTVSLSTLYRF